MSHDPTVRDVQQAIAVLKAWADGATCPDWGREIVKAAAYLVESILCQRDAEVDDA